MAIGTFGRLVNSDRLRFGKYPALTSRKRVLHLSILKHGSQTYLQIISRILLISSLGRLQSVRNLYRSVSRAETTPPFFLNFSRNTMKQNKLGMIFSELKAKHSNPEGAMGFNQSIDSIGFIFFGLD